MSIQTSSVGKTCLGSSGGKRKVSFYTPVLTESSHPSFYTVKSPSPLDVVPELPKHPPDLSHKADLGLGEEQPEINQNDEFDSIDINPELSEREENLFRQVLNRFRNVFRAGWGLLNDGSEMVIKLKPGTEPIAQAPFRNSPKAKEVMDPILDEMRAKGRSRLSSSPWASPVFTVEQHGKKRLVIDFRKVNSVVERDQYPIPRQDEIFAAVSGAQYITTLDLTKGFYQIPIAEESRPITAFTSHRGLEELNVTVMGYKNSPAYFQRKMDQLLARWRWQSVIAYLDDLIIWSQTAEQHAVDLANVLEAFDKVNLTLSPSKAHVGYFNTETLGHRVGRLGLGTVKEKVEGMLQMRRPQNLKDLETAIGTFGYYRHFIPNFAQLAKPLYEAKKGITSGLRVVYRGQDVSGIKTDKPVARYEDLTNKKFAWTGECESSFQNLKEVLCSPTTLMAPQWDRPFVMYCDASYDGYGIALHQIPVGLESKRKNERPIVYLSRSLGKHESNYSPTELEAGCLVWGVTKLSHYLDGASLEIVTDHAALQWILKVKDSPSTRHNNRLLRWSILLSQYADKLTVTHRPGVAHGNVDGLSRLVAKVADEDVVKSSLGVFIETLSSPAHEKDDWHEAYSSDVSLRAIYSRLHDESSSLEHQASYHAFSFDPATKRLYCTIDRSLKLCVPLEILWKKIKFAHERYSHLGADKTLDRLSRSYWHPLMRREVLRIVRDCASCRENAILRHKPWGLAQPVISPSVPFHTIATDFVTGLPASSFGGEDFDAFMTVTCKFTKVLRIIPCRADDSAEITAKRFFNVIYRYHGAPEAIISDCDPQFTSRFWTELCRLMGIERKLSTSYHPQTDGQSEKSNQTVEVALRHCVDYSQESWAKYIPEIEFSINTSKNDTTKTSPYRVLYGFDLRDGLSVLSGLTERNPSAQEFRDNVARIRQEVSGAIALAQARQARYYDEKHTPKTFEVGDMVMLDTRDFRIPGVSQNKIGPKRIGPFRILEKHGRLAYRIDLPPTYRIHPVISIAKLEPATKDGHRHSRPPPIVKEKNPEEEVEYEVEDIESEATVRRSLKYLVRWKGYADHEMTWEPATEVSRGAKEIVRAWKQDMALGSVVDLRGSSPGSGPRFRPANQIPSDVSEKN